LTIYEKNAVQLVNLKVMATEKQIKNGEELLKNTAAIAMDVGLYQI